MIDKLVVSNRSVLRAKYTARGFARIKSALARLAAADKGRGILSNVVYLDDARAMRSRKGRAVDDASDEVATKRAIDALCRAEDPDYLMIVGAGDVVTQQSLDNPVKDDDPDLSVPSDLPYACDVAYSRDIARFVGPTRVVGRVPDIAGTSDPADAAYLVRLLDIAARHQSREPEAFRDYFALTARSWEQSTRKTLFEIFGNDDACRTSPPSGPRFSEAALRARSHFINCHGDIATPEFQGQFRRDYPIALTTRTVDNKIIEGTVAAVECCYGAEMYEARTLGIDLPIGQSYLYQGAYAWLGSSTIAYGPARTNAAADLVTRYFLLGLLEGGSCGRALLAARQRYAQEASELDPIDLKTLAQFTLLGDPSVHPVRVPSATKMTKNVSAGEGRRLLRRTQRARAKVAGNVLLASKPTASKPRREVAVAPRVRRTLASIAKASGVATARFRAYAVSIPQPLRARGKVAASSYASRYFVAVQKRSSRPRAPDLVAVVAKEVAGRIVAYRVYERR
ncbi:MAG TPA: hypothetical protein VNG69_17185 [Casimicrobiaceae bacterium]|nr:hypothetical protein [Casimicrobiaceae bacterium]